MGEVLPIPRRGEVFTDARGQGRSLRVSWHDADEGTVSENTLVISLWQLGQCRATFRLPASSVPDLIRTLNDEISEVTTQSLALTRPRVEPVRFLAPPLLED